MDRLGDELWAAALRWRQLIECKTDVGSERPSREPAPFDPAGHVDTDALGLIGTVELEFFDMPGAQVLHA
jgi:hypothetical protein